MVKDREVWHTAVHGVTKNSDTSEQLNNNSEGITWIITGVIMWSKIAIWILDFMTEMAPSAIHISKSGIGLPPYNINKDLMIYKFEYEKP